VIAREPGSAYFSGMTDSLFKFKVFFFSPFSLPFLSSFSYLSSSLSPPLSSPFLLSLSCRARPRVLVVGADMDLISLFSLFSFSPSFHPLFSLVSPFFSLFSLFSSSFLSLLSNLLAGGARPRGASCRGR
jgi:hypothetical protein